MSGCHVPDVICKCVTCLESKIDSLDEKFSKKIDYWFENGLKRIVELEIRIKDLELRLNEMKKVWKEDIKKYESYEINQDQKIKQLEELYQSDARNLKQILSELAKDNVRLNELEKKPHKCPVCEGMTIYQCECCNISRIIW